jgi:2-methylisocitrate lyase-like PEP mutase family enzyme
MPWAPSTAVKALRQCDRLMSAFLDLHRPGEPLLCPNPWDVGSARLLESLGFEALATTSSGYAASLGKLDGSATREETIAGAAAIAAAVSVPVTVDFEDGFGATADEVAVSVRLAADAGLAGCSLEDWDGERFYPVDVAAARIAAAIAVAGDDIVVTARADNFVHGVDDLGDTITRLQAYEAAGAHILYAPGPDSLEEIEAVIASVSRPVNVLMRPGGPTVPQLAGAGVARITVGGSFAFVALGALVEAAEELRGPGTTDYARQGAIGQKAVAKAFRRD